MELTPSTNRDQISFGSIEDLIEKDNAVRVIEAFVEHIDLNELGLCYNRTKNRRATQL